MVTASWQKRPIIILGSNATKDGKEKPSGRMMMQKMSVSENTVIHMNHLRTILNFFLHATVMPSFSI